jgi:hypothetical protein
MTRAWVAVLVVLLAFTAGCGAGSDAQARAELEASHQQVLTHLDDLVPSLQRVSGAQVQHGEVHFESCTAPIAGDVQVVAELQLGYTRTPYDALASRVGDQLRAAGWKVGTAGPATRDGYQLLLWSEQDHYPALSIRSPCVDTSKSLDQEYSNKPRFELPAPWKPVATAS